jgi:ParB family chromosome partitioning protein
MDISVDKILPNPEQPRTIFDEQELKQLAGTMKDKDIGQIHPIIVEKAPDGYFILIDGERRLQACKLNGSKTIRAEVRNNASNERLELALISNIQKSTMGPVDEARAYEKLIKKYKTAAAVSKRIGVNPMVISSRISLLELPEEVQRLYNLKVFPMSPEVLRSLKKLDPESMISVATKAASRGWTASGIQLAVGKQLKNDARIVRRKEREMKRLRPARDVKAETPTEPKPEPVQAEPTPRTYNTYQVDHTGHFNALAMVGDRHHLPTKAITATLGTCMACSLYKEAGPKICGQCPMVDFLNRLVVEIKKS